jgi:probable dihydroxyacetone kinase regulator
MILPQTATGGYGIRPYGCRGAARPTPRIRRNAYNKENAPMSQMTKRALVASLKDLLAEKPLDKITVTDLTEHCGVNRMTFYYHFKDIYDLVEWACIESATRALAGQKTYDTWQQGFLQILQALQKDKVFVTKVYHSISREHIENYLYRLTYDLMIGVVEEKAAGMTVRPEDKEFIANFYKYAFVGLTLEWVRTGMKDDPAALIERVSTLILGDITKALEACRIDK